jgi:ubiquinol oxidase
MKISVSEVLAKSQTRFFRFMADQFFAQRYGHRAVVLETIAGVPGMVAGMWIHLKSLRQMRTGYGPMIRELLAEAENERMHLMFFIEIAKPNFFERWLILAAQAVFWNYYFLLYLCSAKTAHLTVHYFEQEAVKSYTSYLEMVENGEVENVAAPQLAIDYYGMAEDAKLRDLIIHVRADEERHAVANARFSGAEGADDARAHDRGLAAAQSDFPEPGVTDREAA